MSKNLSYHFSLPSYRLPLKIIFFEKLKLINIQGNNVKKYLQSQFTANIFLLKENNYLITAHCNVYGKVLGIFPIFLYKDSYFYTIYNDISEIQMNELKKYAIFSNIKICENDQKKLLGVVGKEAKFFLKQYFPELPNKNKKKIVFKKNILLWFEKPIERYLIIIDQLIFNKIKKINQLQLSKDEQWFSLDMECGFPVINNYNIRKFFPQFLNLEKFNAISFKKGCYLGQEIISRIQYRGKNKFSIFLLEGTSSVVPSVKSILEIKVKDSWKETGNILHVTQLDNKIIWIQVLLSSQSETADIFRIIDDKNSRFFIKKIS
ncbi:tRNA-modifying protein YgfZ [Candidatus Tachikawaea gelatinosa]|uniref:tRNA-modifying protein YgfZ n=1 Tax=Candidatus Tachikawaea gelatinosa TaxID=1410383 RepID=UPI000597497A|nr:tRNA-modifying protein YgfZ [Candidatus Tachikawaea gelatinosa]